MKEITVSKTFPQQIIKRRTIKVKKYVAEDGTEFDTDYACRNYERKIRLDKIKREDVDIYPFFSGGFYYVDSEDTLDFLNRNVLYTKGITVNGHVIQVGDWVLGYEDYFDDRASVFYTITLKEVFDALEQIK